MPERDKRVDEMARTIAGAPLRPWDARLGEKPEETDEAAWDEARQMADRLYVDLVESIDFQRILVETIKRHAIVHPEKSSMLAAPGVGVECLDSLCHRCLTEVMLQTETNPPWGEVEESPRYLLYQEEMAAATLISPWDAETLVEPLPDLD